ncbi:FAD-dependent oxidoreductase [Isoptericola sp. 4D.3]|uniref:FAD-dependent oxidoreductase n=1 Tax=Isoptericola peretonis TaxID=2918523 RepID=A0ABT0J454_9MICO|nr:FAD-dependent oxidoreductase [Isoptericola sp. 4D.3]
MTVDVVVVGAGIVGAACARALARRGLAVTVLDRRGAASGTTAHGEGNLLVSDKEPGPELLLAQHAARRWPSLVAELDDELGGARHGFPPLEYDPKGGLVAATTTAGAQPLRDFAARQRGAGVDAREVDVAQALELEPALNPGLTAAVWYPEDAQVQPVAAAEALLASARHAGATVRTGVEVVGALRDGDRLVGVRTSGGDVPAAAVVLAAGPWSGVVAARLGVALPVRPRRGMVLVTTRMPHVVRHKVYDGDYVGATQSGDASLQTSSVVESTAAGTVLIGSSREQVGFDERLRVAVLREMAARAIRLFPFLADASAMRAYLGFRPYVPDHLPIVGPDPRTPGLWVATGHEGAGIGLGPVSGELLADLYTGAEPAVDPAPFRVDRPAVLAAAPWAPPPSDTPAPTGTIEEAS